MHRCGSGNRGHQVLLCIALHLIRQGLSLNFELCCGQDDLPDLPPHSSWVGVSVSTLCFFFLDTGILTQVLSCGCRLTDPDSTVFCCHLKSGRELVSWVSRHSSPYPFSPACLVSTLHGRNVHHSSFPSSD